MSYAHLSPEKKVLLKKGSIKSSPAKSVLLLFFLVLVSIVSVNSIVSAKADSVATPMASPAPNDASAKSGAINQRFRLYLMLDATTSNPIAIAEQKLKEFPGFLVRYDADVRRNQLYYEYGILQPDKRQVVELEVEAATGKLVIEQVTDIDDDYPHTAEQFRSIIPFINVWKSAEQTFGRKLAQMEIDRSRSYFIYKGEIVDEFLESSFRINANDGRLIPTR